MLLLLAAFGLPAFAQDTTSVDSVAMDSAVVESAAVAEDSDLYGPRLPPGGLAPDTAAAAALIRVAEDAGPDTSDAGSAETPAPLYIGGKQVMDFRVSYGGIPPIERVETARRRIARAAADRSVPLDSLRLIRVADGIEFRLGPYFLFAVSPGDADVSDSHELAARISRLTQDVRDGIENERSGRTPLRLLISAGLALLLTIVAYIVARLLGALGARWRDWLQRNLSKKIPAIRFRNFEVLPGWQAAGFVQNVLGRLDVVVGLLLFYWYLAAVFSLFPWTQGWAWRLLHFALSNVMQILGGFAAALPGLFIIALIFLLFRWLTQLSDRFFTAVDEGQLPLPWLHPELVRPSRRLVRILLWIVAFTVAYPYLPGSDSRAVQGVSILLGVMVSLGSTGIVSNVLAGLVLTYSRSFRQGDRVRIGTEVGDVISLGFFATKIRTIRNEEVTIPNGLVANGAITNYTRLAKGDGLILHTKVTLGYDTEWRKVHALLIDAAKSVEGIDQEPEPWVFQRALNDFHVTYELNASTKLAEKQMDLYSDLHAAIQDKFAEAGVEILSPGYQTLRDGNADVLPAEPTGPRNEPGGFRLKKDSPA